MGNSEGKYLTKDETRNLASSHGVCFDDLEFRRLATAEDTICSSKLQSLHHRIHLPEQQLVKMSIRAERVAWQLEDAETPTTLDERITLLIPLPNIAPESGCQDRCFELIQGSAISLSESIKLELSYTFSIWIKPLPSACTILPILTDGKDNVMSSLLAFQVKTKSTFVCGAIDSNGNFHAGEPDQWRNQPLAKVMVNRWQLILASGCIQPPQRGFTNSTTTVKTNFWIASDHTGFHYAGTASSSHSQPAITIDTIGCTFNTVGFISEINLWGCKLEEKQFEALFSASADRHGIDMAYGQKRRKLLLGVLGLIENVENTTNSKQVKSKPFVEEYDGEEGFIPDSSWDGVADFSPIGNLTDDELTMVTRTAGNQLRLNTLILSRSGAFTGSVLLCALVCFFEDGLPPNLRTLDISNLNFQLETEETQDDVGTTLLEVSESCRKIGVQIIAKDCIGISCDVISVLGNNSKEARAAAELHERNIADSVAQENEYAQLQKDIMQMWVDDENGIPPRPIVSTTGICCVPPALDGGDSATLNGNMEELTSTFWVSRNRRSSWKGKKGKKGRKGGRRPTKDSDDEVKSEKKRSIEENIYLIVVKPFLIAEYNSLIKRLMSDDISEMEITQRIVDSEELSLFISKDEEGRQAHKAHKDISENLVREFRAFLEERKRWTAERRLVALHEALADRLWNTKAEAISKLLDPKSNAEGKTMPNWCSKFVEETYRELDDKETDKPIKYPDAKRVWKIMKNRIRNEIDRKKRKMRKIQMDDLREFGKLTHDQKGSEKNLPSGCGSGMIISHFSHIAGHKQGLLSPNHFSFKSVKNRPVSKALALLKKNGTVLTLHEAVESERVKISHCTGNSYGKNALCLTLQTIRRGGGPFTVAVEKGTIFQHIDWVHKQNLMVIKTVYIFMSGTSGETRAKRINAHCMNSMCCCSEGESMTLTKFYFDESVLGIQGKVWDFLNDKISAGRNAPVTKVPIKSKSGQ